MTRRGAMRPRRTSSLRLLIGVAAAISAHIYAFGQVRSIPEALASRELELCAGWLALSGDQGTIALSFFEQYRVEYEANLLEDIRAYHRSARDADRRVWARDADRGALARELYPPLWREQAALRQRLQSLEDSFLSQIESLLTAEQMARMDRVRRGYTRIRFERHQNRLPEGNVDLVTFVDALMLSFDERVRTEEKFVAIYEPRLIELLVADEQADFNRLKDYWPIYDLQRRIDLHHRGGPTLTGLEMRNTLNEIARLEQEAGRARIAAAEHLVRLNRQSLDELMRLLHGAAAEHVYRQYHEISYPQVYPDPTSAAALYDAAESIETLNETQRSQIAVLRGDWSRRHELLCEQMAESVYDVFWTTYSGTSSRRGTTQDAWNSLRDLGYEREAHNVGQADLVRACLTPEQAALLPERDFENDPPRRRWDRPSGRVG